MEKCKVDALLTERAGLKDEEGSFCWIFDFSWQCHRPALPSPRGGREQFSNNKENSPLLCPALSFPWLPEDLPIKWLFRALKPLIRSAKSFNESFSLPFLFVFLGWFFFGVFKGSLKIHKGWQRVSQATLLSPK